jgi:hypothetical protein
MAGTRYTVQDCSLTGWGDVVYEGDLQEVVMQKLSTELQVTISDVTMSLAAWTDPEHWSEEWALELSVPEDEVADAVAGLIAAAQEPA